MRIHLFVLFLISTFHYWTQTDNVWNYELSKTCFNSPHDDFGVRKIAGRYFLISASVDEKNNVITDPTKGQPYTDLFELIDCDRKDAYLKNYITGNLLLSTPKYDGTISGDQFGQIIFFSFNNYDSLREKSGLFYLKRMENGWSDPNYFPLNSKNYNIYHPCFDPSSNQLFFSSDMQGGKGGLDLYKVSFDGESFGNPQSLSEVNTEKDEIFPYFKDGLLYFTSNRNGTYGGLDIFNFDGEKVTNLGTDINSVYDDFDFYPSGNQSGFISSNREQKGKNDEIFYVTWTRLKGSEFIHESELEIISNINKNIELYQKIKGNSDLNDSILSLINDQKKLKKNIEDLSSSNTQLNDDLSKLLNQIIRENLHSTNGDYQTKDQLVFELNSKIESLVASSDSIEFRAKYEDLLSFINSSFGENSQNYTEILEKVRKNGLDRIALKESVDKNINSLIERNEVLFFGGLVEKPDGLTEGEWKQLSNNQAEITRQTSLLDELRKAQELNRLLEEQNRKLELLLSQLTTSFGDDKYNSFYKLDSLFNEFKRNPSQEIAGKLISLLKEINLIEVKDLSSLLDSKISLEKDISMLQGKIDIQTAKTNSSFKNDFNNISDRIRKGETIGLKEIFNDFKENYTVTISSKAELILDKNIFFKEDLVSKFGSIGNILFNFDSFQLTHLAKDQLDSVVYVLKQYPSIKILLNGYTDNVGSDNYNLNLSKNRADKVLRYLVKKGINKKNIVINFFGEKFPTDNNLTSKGRKLNRRVELKIEIK